MPYNMRETFKEHDWIILETKVELLIMLKQSGKIPMLKFQRLSGSLTWYQVKQRILT